MPLNTESLKGGGSPPEPTPAPPAPAAPQPEKTKPKEKTKHGGVFIATTSGSSQGKKGDVYVFVKGVTRVREGHELLKLCPDYFEPAEDHIHYGEETR